MVRLIDADAIERCLVIGGRRHGKTIISEIIRRAIQAAPTVDAEPVRHGRWLCSDDLNENGICSECMYDSYEPFDYVCGEWKYCPRCGAKMERKDDETD